MRYSTKKKFWKYVIGYEFLSFDKKFGDKYGKKLMATATRAGIYAAKAVSNRVVQKKAETTGDLIGNKMADKITSIGKSKEKENSHSSRKKTEIDGPKLSWMYKNGILKKCKFARYDFWW